MTQPQSRRLGRARPAGPSRAAPPAWPRAARPLALALGASLACLSAAAEPAKTRAIRTATTGAQTDALTPDVPAPKPITPSARETAYLAKLDEVVAPVRDYELSAEDAAKLREAITALGSDKPAKAAELKAGIGDPIARKLIQWQRLRQGYGEAAEYRAFLEENPDWPSRDMLQRRMEEMLFVAGGAADEIAAYFKDREPHSAAGLAALASVHLAHGEKEKARALAARVWREHDLAPDLERGFFARFGSLLALEDHKWRLDRLLGSDVRGKTEREARAAPARRVIALLPKDEQERAQARLKVFLRADAGKSGLKAGDWGTTFHKVQKLRRAGKLDEAAKLVLGAPTDPKEIANLDGWWTERQHLAYLALKADKPKLAYELVRDAGPLSVNPLNEQAFMAGWIALRYLKDADAALKHFTAYTKSADGPLGRAKSHYWLGRTYEAKGEQAKATEAYRAAARQIDTFHGLLAIQKLDPGQSRITINPPAAPSPDQVARFRGLDVAKAVGLTRAAGLSRAITRIFLRHLAKLENSEAWSALAAHLARAIGDTQTGVHIGKAAIGRGHNLVYYSYPVDALPAYTPLRKPPETAFLLGVARQETEFNPEIISVAGARGLLQVMKVTANHVCRDYKIKCHHDRLLSDTSYNTMIASAYIADRMGEFSGSYVLGLSSYNAGPGRTRQWIREFGDPRTAEIDPIDWIERIPIEETRKYVPKVLSNIQIYRARLGEEDTALRLEEDLARARAASLAPQRKVGDRAQSAE